MANSRRNNQRVSELAAALHMQPSRVSTGMPDHDWLQQLNGTRVRQTHQTMKLKSRRSLAAGKLQPLYKDQTGLPHNTVTSSSSRVSERFRVLPGILRRSVDSSVEKVLCGEFTDVPRLEALNSVRVYVSYNSRDMKVERDWLQQTAVPELINFCSEHMLSFLLVDIEAISSQSECSIPASLSTTQITQCREQSVGPNFVMLLGDDCGPMLPAAASIPASDFESLMNCCPEAVDLLMECYRFDAGSGLYLIHESVDMEKVCELGRLLAISTAVDENFKHKHLLSRLECEAERGILTVSDPRSCCCCYRRKLSNSLSSSTLHSTATQSTAESLWQKLHQTLGPTHCKVYSVGEDSANNRTEYLNNLAADFVSDIKDMIQQRLPAILHSRKNPESALIREITHHANLQAEFAKKFVASDDSKILLKRIHSFVQDPRQSCCPFIIHGECGSGKSMAMSALCAAVRDWCVDVVSVVRYIGTSSYSTSVHSLVANIAVQVRLAYHLPEPAGVPANTLHEELVSFQDTLQSVSRLHAHSRPLFILLDAVDQLSPHRDALEALWLLHQLPPNIHVIMSTVSSANTVGADVLGALVGLITDAQLTYQLQHSTSGSESDRLMVTLDEMETDYGHNTTALFAAYLTIAHVGILDTEMAHLLSSHPEVMAEISHADQVCPVFVSVLCSRLRRFIERRLVGGCVGFGWSRVVFAALVARRYNVIASGSNNLTTAATSFTLRLHEHFANLYTVTHSSLFDDELTGPVPDSGEHAGPVPDSGEHAGPVPDSGEHAGPVPDSGEHAGPVLERQQLTSASCSAANSVMLMRLAHHLRILLPVEGFSRLKHCVLFNFDFLAARLAACPLFVSLNDTLSLYSLGCDMRREGIVDDDCEDVAILFEFLQLAAESLRAHPHNLASQILTRLATFAHKFPSISTLVQQARHWLETTQRAILTPLGPAVWTAPGGLIRHRLHGLTHVLGYLATEDAVVGFSRSDGIGVWRVQSGILVHQYEVHCEQSLDGIIPGHDGAFIILSHYSPITCSTDLSVLSTETGIVVLKATFAREFESICVSSDDQLVAVSSHCTASDATAAAAERCILGIQLLTRDIVFNLPVTGVHQHGIQRLFFVHNILPSISLVSIGTTASSDVALWDIDNNVIQFSLRLDHSVDMCVVSILHKVLVCANVTSGCVTFVSLIHGIVDRTLQADDYRAMTDIVVNGNNVYIATPSSGVVIMSVTQNTVATHLHISTDAARCYPTKLLIHQDASLVVGCSNGTILIFCLVTERLVQQLIGHTDAVNSLLLARDAWLVSAASDHMAIVWKLDADTSDSAAAGGMKQTSELGDAGCEVFGICCFALYRDEHELVAGSTDGNITFWDIHTGTLLRRLPGRPGSIVDNLYLVFQERYLVAEYIDHSISQHIKLLQVWDLEVCELVPLQTGDQEMVVYCTKALPSDDKIVSIGRLTDEQQQQQQQQQQRIVVAVHNVHLRQTLSVLHCNIFADMDASNLRILGFSSLVSDPLAQSSAKKSSKTSKVAMRSRNVALRLTSTNTCDAQLMFVLDYSPPHLGTSYYFTFRVDDQGVFMDHTEPLQVHTTSPSAAILLPLGGTCLCGTVSGSILTWNIRSQKPEACYVDHSLRQHRSSKKGSCSSRGLAHQGPVSSTGLAHQGSVSSTGLAHQGPVSSTGLAHQGSVSSTGLAHQGPVSSTGLAHQGPVSCLCVDRGSQLVVSAGDHSVKLWNTVSRQLVYTLAATHSAQMSSVLLTSDLSLLLTVSSDGLVVLAQKSSNSNAYNQLTSCHLHGNATSCVAMTTDHQRVVATMRHGIVGQQQPALVLLRAVNIS